MFISAVQIEEIVNRLSESKAIPYQPSSSLEFVRLILKLFGDLCEQAHIAGPYRLIAELEPNVHFLSYFLGEFCTER